MVRLGNISDSFQLFRSIGLLFTCTPINIVEENNLPRAILHMWIIDNMWIINNYVCGLLIIITKVHGKPYITTLVSNVFLFLAAKCTYSGDESSII